MRDRKSKPIRSTTIGSFPKPGYLKLNDWFRSGTCNWIPDADRKEIEEKQTVEITRAIRETLQLQERHGIDILSDGEMNRENYILYHCRYFTGIDFVRTTRKMSRNKAFIQQAPTITGRIACNDTSFILQDWKRIRACTKDTDKIKITVPGPMTIMDSLYDNHYQSTSSLRSDLCKAINTIVLTLDMLGCKYIQIDEPVFARYPKKALEYGIADIERCFKDVGDDVQRIIHICCGYPDHLDQENYRKADPNAYLKIAKRLNQTRTIDCISIEDAHRRTPFEQLLPLLNNKTIILGVIDVSSSTIEDPNHIVGRIYEAMFYTGRDRLIVAPDCGLGLLTYDLIDKKLASLSRALEIINN